MQKDTRSRNLYFHHQDITTYVKQYAGSLASALNKIDPQHLEMAQKVIDRVHKTGSRIFVGGNGGSAAISDHLACDFVKGVYSDKISAVNAHSLISHTALFTAIANDLGYEHTLSEQLEMARAVSDDALLLISSSGNSSNIIKALEVAKKYKMTVIGMTGFSGGKLRELADVKLHVDAFNYGVVEDCHQALMHILAQCQYLKCHDV